MKQRLFCNEIIIMMKLNVINYKLTHAQKGGSGNAYEAWM